MNIVFDKIYTSQILMREFTLSNNLYLYIVHACNMLQRCIGACIFISKYYIIILMLLRCNLKVSGRKLLLSFHGQGHHQYPGYFLHDVIICIINIFWGEVKSKTYVYLKKMFVFTLISISPVLGQGQQHKHEQTFPSSNLQFPW